MAYRRTPAVQARLDGQREALLGAAADLLAEGGYAACTVSAVARRAGVADGTLYTHFGAKADLAAELFRRIVGREVEAVRAAAAHGSATERVAAIVETFAGRALKQPRRAYALLVEPVDPAIDELRLQFRTAFRGIVAEAVRAGIDDGELAPQDPDVAAAALVGAIAEVLRGPLSAGPADTSPDPVPALVDFVHRALGGHVRAHA